MNNKNTLKYANSTADSDEALNNLLKSPLNHFSRVPLQEQEFNSNLPAAAFKNSKKAYKKCPHYKRKDNCKICSPHLFCQHNRRKRRCKECGTGRCKHNRIKGQCEECGTGFCKHNKFKRNCLECMPIEKAQARGMVCKICFAKSTRNGICKNCSLSFTSSTDVSIEGTIKLCLRHFFGEAMESNYRKFIGGSSCKENIDGPEACEHKTKGAYIDIPIVLQDRVIFSEVDENLHRFYEVPCELGRYDTLVFGTDQLRATFINRFNPAKKTRCSQATTKKDSNLCHRHFNYQERGGIVVLD